jgi:hypothetical protein
MAAEAAAVRGWRQRHAAYPSSTPKPSPRASHPVPTTAQKEKIAGLLGAAKAAHTGGAVYGAGMPVLTAPGIIGGAAPMFAGGIQ